MARKHPTFRTGTGNGGPGEPRLPVEDGIITGRRRRRDGR